MEERGQRSDQTRRPAPSSAPGKGGVYTYFRNCCRAAGKILTAVLWLCRWRCCKFTGQPSSRQHGPVVHRGGTVSRGSGCLTDIIAKLRAERHRHLSRSRPCDPTAETSKLGERRRKRQHLPGPSWRQEWCATARLQFQGCKPLFTSGLVLGLDGDRVPSIWDEASV